MTTYELVNDRLRARFSVSEDGVQQEYFARRGAEWIAVVESLQPTPQAPEGALPLYDVSLATQHRFLAASALRSAEKRSEQEIVLRGDVDGAAITQTVTLKPDADHVHIRVEVTLGKPELEYILSAFAFKGANPPEFIHTSKLKYADDDIIGDRMFHSPAVIVQDGETFCALVPDLDLINECYVIAPEARQVATGHAFCIPLDRNTLSMPTGMDFHLKSGWTESPLLAYGVIDGIATHHMHWRHPSDGSQVRRLNSLSLCYGFDLFANAEMPRFKGFQRITRHLWECYGSPTLSKPRPQAMPLADYARVCYPAGWVYQGSDVVLIDGDRNAAHQAPQGFPNLDSWLEWEVDGLPVGGYRNAAPQWYDYIGNTPFWNNARDAIGMYWWGKHLNDEDMLDKARRMINFCLVAPQHNGMFATIYQYTRQLWRGNHWEPPPILDPNRTNERYFVDDAVSYHAPSMSLTAGYMLRYYRECEANPGILDYLRPYAEFLLAHIEPNGGVPNWFNPDGQPNPHLRFNSEAGSSAWFLAKFSRLTDDQRYLDAAKRIGGFLMREILPTQHWVDTECYFSCGSKPLDYVDARQGQAPRGSLGVLAAAEGFAALYRATGERHYLDAGEQALDYAVFFQAVWQPHYIITAYAYGGWDTDNGDAAWLDARQGIVVDMLIWYGRELGRQDLLERAVASARSGLVLVNHERHIANDIYAYPNYPYGIGPENIDHEGQPQSPMRTNASWGEVTGLDGVADALRVLGGVYVDLDNDMAVGVDGVYVRNVTNNSGVIDIQLDNQMDTLAHPFAGAYPTTLRLVGAQGDNARVLVNGTAVYEGAAGNLLDVPIGIEGQQVARG